jgi:type II secretory pathway pseudopilin PulG
MTDGQNSMRIRSSDDGGYILAVLLIGMAIAAVWLTASLPAWRQQAQREKEEELVFRGEQYARAIALFYIKNNTFPPDVDTLVSQHYLRKKWKDPITNDDFDLIMAGQAAPSRQSGPGTTPGANPGAARGTPGASSPNTPSSPLRGGSPAGSTQTLTGGGFQGVASKSKDTSIRIYAPPGGTAAAAQEYDLWVFNYTSACRKMTGSANCRPAQQGQPNGAPGGPGGRNGPGGANGQNGPGGLNGQPGRNGVPGPSGRNGQPGNGPIGPVQGGGRGRGGF